MPDQKISADPSVVVLGPTDIVPVIQGGLNKKAIVSQFTSASIFDALSVKSFGAVGNGIADDTAAINACIAAAIAGGTPGYTGGALPVYIPTGKYKLTDELVLNTKALTIFGDGMAATQLIQTVNAKNIFHMNEVGGLNNVIIRDLGLTGPGIAVSSGNGFKLDTSTGACDAWSISNVFITGFLVGFRATDFSNSTLFNVNFFDNATSVLIDGISNSLLFHTCPAVTTSGSGNTGYNLTQGRNIAIVGGDLGGTTMTKGVILNGANLVLIRDCNCELNGPNPYTDGFFSNTISNIYWSMINVTITGDTPQIIYPIVQTTDNLFLINCSIPLKGINGGQIKHTSSINTSCSAVNTNGALVDVYSGATFLGQYNANNFRAISQADGTGVTPGIHGNFFTRYSLGSGEDLLYWHPQLGGASTGATIGVTVVAIAAGGINYVVGNVLTADGGTQAVVQGAAATFVVNSIGAGGTITGIGVLNRGCYSIAPSSPNAATGGAGTGASLTLTTGFFIRDNLNQYNTDTRSGVAAKTNVDTTWQNNFSYSNLFNLSIPVSAGGTKGGLTFLANGGGKYHTMWSDVLAFGDIGIWQATIAATFPNYSTALLPFYIDPSNKMHLCWNTTGSPTGTNLVNVYGDIGCVTVGGGLLIKEGANAKMGTATLNGITEVTINTTKVTANSRIMLTIQAPGGTVGIPYVSSRIGGTSFGVKSTNAADSSTVAWIIFEPNA